MPQILFCTEDYTALGDELCAVGQFERGVVESKEFPDGEHYRRISTACRNRDVVLLGGSISDRATLELYDIACALVYGGVQRLSLVIPFYGYSTMERAVKSGEIVTAKARARLFSSIPLAAMGNRVFLVDLHVQGITHYFEGAMQPIHLSARPMIKKVAKSLGGSDFVLACTDAGRAKWVENLANDLGVTAAFAYKRRMDGSTTEVVGVSAHVAGQNVVIYDDMIRTGGSLIGAAQAYKNAGATNISALCTHGVFPGAALQTLRASGLFSRIVSTDTHPNAVALGDDFLQVHSVASLLNSALEQG